MLNIEINQSEKNKVNPPNILSCADNDNFLNEKSSKINPKYDDFTQYCKKCQNQSQFSSRIDSPKYEKQIDNYFQQGPQSAYLDKNRKVIINAEFNFPKKGELEVLMDKSMHENKSISFSVIYQKFENEIKGG